MKNKPLVAIHCLVYNHEPYLRDCLNGFVSQRTTFPFVAIVHDDASTDGSAAIIREYADKYPDIIHPIYETENQYSKHNGSIETIMDDAIRATKCKYIAFCEGDDYWTNHYKLQNQVNILEEHPNGTLCYTDYQTVDEKGILFNWSNHQKHVKLSFSGDNFRHLIRSNYIITASTLFRADVLLKPVVSITWDYSRFLNAAMVGYLYYMSDRTVCYRLQPNSILHTSFDLVSLGLKEVWYKFALYYVETPSVHRNILEHLMILATIDANLISKMRQNDADSRRARKMILSHAPLMLAFPISIIIRVKNNIYKKLQFLSKPIS